MKRQIQPINCVIVNVRVRQLLPSFHLPSFRSCAQIVASSFRREIARLGDRFAGFTLSCRFTVIAAACNLPLPLSRRTARLIPSPRNFPSTASIKRPSESPYFPVFFSNGRKTQRVLKFDYSACGALAKTLPDTEREGGSQATSKRKNKRRRGSPPRLGAFLESRGCASPWNCPVSLWWQVSRRR